MPPTTNNHQPPTAIRAWLTACLLLIACMVLLGGYTRLSGSGLSITAWKPIHGTLPPLNETEWQEEFSAYQASPQYVKINKGMTLLEFKAIFWPEYLHRLLGRLIGIVFFLPLVVFAWRRHINRKMAWRLAGIFALGGLQGMVGWLMVKSGLIDTPYISPVRLALHLSLALAIFALIEWELLNVVASGKWQVASKRKDAFLPLTTYHLPLTTYPLWFSLLCLQIILGALMAGNHAGLIYNTWPTMNGEWIPDGLFIVSPWYVNITLIQFMHRTVAIIVVLWFGWLWHMARKSGTNIQPKRLLSGMASLLLLQIILGVLTLLHRVPLWLALAHQMTALLLFAAAVVALHKLSGKWQVAGGK